MREVLETGENGAGTYPLPLRPTQIPHELAWDRNLAFAVRYRRYTA